MVPNNGHDTYGVENIKYSAIYDYQNTFLTKFTCQKLTCDAFWRRGRLKNVGNKVVTKQFFGLSYHVMASLGTLRQSI